MWQKESSELSLPFDYPRDKLEIQICDDSNDETVTLIDRLVADLTAQGIDIKVLRRSHRQGYKAGALAEGMLQAGADFLAIFDADFVPGADFLKRALPTVLDDERVAFVQTRWGHLNRRTNMLTYCQALGIDGHFLVEQPGRANGNLLLNFNGTCGLWRKRAIAEAGGWTSDTLTEDLDLSYRVQLAAALSVIRNTLAYLIRRRWTGSVPETKQLYTKYYGLQI